MANSKHLISVFEKTAGGNTRDQLNREPEHSIETESPLCFGLIAPLPGIADTLHPGLALMHERLSERAPPNYDGVIYRYSDINPEEYKVAFQNHWARNLSAEQDSATAFVLHVFDDEYNEVWPKAWEAL